MNKPFPNVTFTPVTEITDPLSLAIAINGGSGSGKTYSALAVASGIAEAVTGAPGAPIGFVDTEARRALHYRSAFPQMHHFDMDVSDIGYTPERWIDVIDKAEAAGLPVLILDSFAHAWTGINGLLELRETELERLTAEAEVRANGRYTVDPARFALQSWADPKRRWRRLIERIVTTRTHIIICSRAKEIPEAGGKRLFKSRLNDQSIPFSVVGDPELLYEMTVSVILDPAAKGCPVHQVKVADQFKRLLDPSKPMSVETGRAMGRWSVDQGDANRQKSIMDAAREAARNGREAYREWHAAQADEARALARTITAELRRIAEAADARFAASDGGDPLESCPPPDAMDRAIQEAAASVAAERDAMENRDPAAF